MYLSTLFVQFCDVFINLIVNILSCDHFATLPHRNVYLKFLHLDCLI